MLIEDTFYVWERSPDGYIDVTTFRPRGERNYTFTLLGTFSEWGEAKEAVKQFRKEGRQMEALTGIIRTIRLQRDFKERVLELGSEEVRLSGRNLDPGGDPKKATTSFVSLASSGMLAISLEDYFIAIFSTLVEEGWRIVEDAITVGA